MSWQRDLKNNVTDLSELSDFLPASLNPEKRKTYEKIIDKYPITIPRYYLSLIDPNDPDDPIRKMAIPSFDEVELSGEEDTSGEADNTVITGMQHKYRQTVLILSTSRCAMYCRHCFRKRMVGEGEKEIARQFAEIIGYIREHKEVNNVLISGGDAFLNSNKMIETYLEELCEIRHLDVIRFGTRTPVVFPQRITEDEHLIKLLYQYCKKKQIYVVTQFNHPNEFTHESVDAVRRLHNAGVVLKNQTVLLKGVNDNPATLSKLLRRITRAGLVPYYVFQCRPVLGVKSQFQVPLVDGIRVVEQAKALQNGQGKCFRYAMSHPTGKIEILGITSYGEMLFKYAQAKYPRDAGRLFTMPVDEATCWLGEIPQGNPSRYQTEDTGIGESGVHKFVLDNPVSIGYTE